MTFVALMLAVFATAPDPPAWQFVLPPAGDAFQYPPLRSIVMSAARPDDLVEKVHYRGHSQRYAQLRYGSPGSVRVTVVLDEVGPGEVDLYLDRDRNRRIEAKDRLEGKGRLWVVPLDIAQVEGETTHYTKRAVVLRVGASGRTLSVAAAGYLEGKVRLAGQERAVRRTDGDTDGFYTGPQDRLWIDLDGDGRFDPLAEQFLYNAMLPIGSERYAARSDPQGTRLSLEPLEGTGTLRLAFARPELKARLSEVHVLLVGRDGSAVGIEGTAGEVTAPVGEYRISALAMSFADPGGGLPWSYVFSDSFGTTKQVWHKVEKGKVVTLDPLGTLQMRLEVNEPLAERKRGAAVTILPRLYTGDGLLINSGYRGAPTAPGTDHQTTARVALRSSGGDELDAVTSGFS